MAFELEELTTLELVNASPRKEHHGESLVQAIDLSLRWETSNESLSIFDGHLLDALYFNREAANGQDRIEGVPAVRPNLRSPKLVMPLKWEWDGTGYTMRIDHGLGGRSDLVLLGCKVSKVKFTLKEGGTVMVDFMVQCNTDVNEKIVGKLCGLEGTDLEASLLAPAETGVIDASSSAKDLPTSSVTSLFGDGPDDDGEPDGEGDAPDATDEFIRRNTEAA